MNVAVALLTGGWPSGSIDFGGYCHALARLGHSPTLVACGHDRTDASFPVVETSLEQMEQAHFWRSLKLDAVIFFNWLHYATIVRAMKQAGLFVISRGDTDGHASARVFPGPAWLTLEDSNDGILVRLRKAKIWMERYLKVSAIEDQDVLQTIEQTDAVAIEGEEAAKNVRRILAYYQRSDLEGKLHVIPHSVKDVILTEKVTIGQRPKTIFCGGRWLHPQKDANLLIATLDILLRRQPHLQVVIAGDGAESLFGPLTHRHPGVNWLRRVPHEKVAALLTNSRVMLSSSRWEGYSILALEALCMGCSFAAPPLPGFISMSENGRFGTVSARRNPPSLVNAVESELKLWDLGSRLPAEISATWRRRTSNDSVMANLLSFIR
jgi:glycosyltransferase involved in cell wall biosynthesis